MALKGTKGLNLQFVRSFVRPADNTIRSWWHDAIAVQLLHHAASRNSSQRETKPASRVVSQIQPSIPRGCHARRGWIWIHGEDDVASWCIFVNAPCPPSLSYDAHSVQSWLHFRWIKAEWLAKTKRPSVESIVQETRENFHLSQTMSSPLIFGSSWHALWTVLKIIMAAHRANEVMVILWPSAHHWAFIFDGQNRLFLGVTRFCIWDLSLLGQFSSSRLTAK